MTIRICLYNMHVYACEASYKAIELSAQSHMAVLLSPPGPSEHSVLRAGCRGMNESLSV